MADQENASERHPVDIEQLFIDGTAIDEAIAQGVRDALLEHQRAGNPVPTWKDGQVVWIPPEEIDV